jgi:3-oxoacyl-[acyl-carrier protein] reductase
MTQAMPAKARETLIAQIPAGRLGQADDVAAAVGYLASEGAGYVTGQVLHVNSACAT